MPRKPCARDNDLVSAPAVLRDGPPRAYRRPERGVLGGVAAGVAAHLGIPVRTVRISFALLMLAGGFGAALYGAYWIVLPGEPDAPPLPSRRRVQAAATVVFAVVAVGAVASALPSGALFVPIVLAGLGGALIWRQASEPQRDRLRRLSRSSLSASGTGREGRLRLAAGAAMVIAGAVLVLARANVTAVRDGIVAVVVATVGLALLTGPWWMRLVTQLSEERAARIRSQERAELAAHLHDSVLQTLALIQRYAESPREVARLARGQERELRTLLYGTRAAGSSVADDLRGAAAEVEDAYAVPVDVVVVGDASSTPALSALVAAAREAIVNAAKHSGADEVSVYAEVEDDAVTAFVRDRGVGFDPETVAGDRQGVRGSIVGRMQRHGGSARIVSGSGRGTEIELRMPR
jgi:signal transduction histidine kinase/phage shock protein PspC (stress-responsive transcriptional regulator)